jgi:hypothetical protein
MRPSLAARTGAVATATSTQIFIAGGEDAAGAPSATVDIFHVTTGVWTRQKMSTPRQGLTLVHVSAQSKHILWDVLGE